MSNNNDIHKELSEILEDLSSRLSKIEKDVHHKESAISADLAEQATENDEVLPALEDGTSENIANIKKALKKMANGNYGHCSVCGVDIPEERMKALPYADKCFNCADK